MQQHMAKIMPATIIARTTAPPTAIPMITPVDKPEWIFKKSKEDIKV